MISLTTASFTLTAASFAISVISISPFIRLTQGGDPMRAANTQLSRKIEMDGLRKISGQPADARKIERS